MAKNATKDENPLETPADLSFEEALKRLEGIVESMEGEELSLDVLLAKYEEGSKLSRICQSKLQQAELKIQQLEKSVGGELVVKPLNIDNPTK